jgi:hypothetical protein
MHIDACTALIHDLHAQTSSRFSLLLLLFAGNLPAGVCFVQCLLRALTVQVRQQAVVRPDTPVVSNARSLTVYCWSSSLWEVLTSSILFFMRCGAPAAHDVSNSGQDHSAYLGTPSICACRTCGRAHVALAKAFLAGPGKSASFQVRTILAKSTRRSRSLFRYAGLFTCRRRMMSWCRNSAFSAISSDFPLSRSASMPGTREVVGGLIHRETRS